MLSEADKKMIGSIKFGVQGALMISRPKSTNMGGNRFKEFKLYKEPA
jgi:hypothetical protein